MHYWCLQSDWEKKKIAKHTEIPTEIEFRFQILHTKWNGLCVCNTLERYALLFMISYGQHNILANKWTNKQTRNASALPHDIHVLIFFRLDYLRYCCSISALYTESIDLFHHIAFRTQCHLKGKIFAMKSECVYACRIYIECVQTTFPMKIERKDAKMQQNENNVKNTILF